MRRANGRLFTSALPPERHRALQLAMLHADTVELVELTAGTRGADGKLELDRRRRPEHHLPGGASGRQGWLEALLEHAEQIVAGRYSRQASNDQLCEEASRRASGAAATSTRSRTPASSGSTSTGPASSPRCRSCWPGGRVTC